MAFQITTEMILQCTSGLFLEPSSLITFADQAAGALQNQSLPLPFKYIHAVVLIKSQTTPASYDAADLSLLDQNNNVCGICQQAARFAIGTSFPLQLMTWGGYTPMGLSYQWGIAVNPHGGGTILYDLAILTK